MFLIKLISHCDVEHLVVGGLAENELQAPTAARGLKAAIRSSVPKLVS